MLQYGTFNFRIFSWCKVYVPNVCVISILPDRGDMWQNCTSSRSLSETSLVNELGWKGRYLELRQKLVIGYQ